MIENDCGTDRLDEVTSSIFGGGGGCKKRVDDPNLKSNCRLEVLKLLMSFENHIFCIE